ncbi:MAG TPA: RIP metalloprotease RseP [Gemmatimonadaceae bacterium]|jgi:regulator of sigma E protease|nr:RIP metalloprotease RseP [Gemmatimonadaceae bacterium]
MLAYIAPIFVFGLVVFVHELGHFLAAKAIGVYTPRFSIGFGRALLRKRWGETEYVLAALPIGGYVRMASRDDEATAFLEGGSENAVTHEATHGEPLDPNAMIPFGPKPIPENRWFESKPLWGRLLILLSGVTMNILLALVVTTGMFVHYGSPYLSTTADSLFAGRPAALAGLQHGDSIVAIEGKSVDWEGLVTKVSASPGIPLRFDVLRNGQRQTITITPAQDTAFNPSTGKTDSVGRIGILPVQRAVPVGWGEAMTSGWRATWRMAGTVIEALHGLATRRVSASELGGPIMIAQASVQAARGGAEQLLFLIALISTNLAVFNLLPIPVLDGGQIIIGLLEGIKGKAFSLRTREYILRAGIFAVLLLFALVTYNDLRRLVVSVVQRLG